VEARFGFQAKAYGEEIRVYKVEKKGAAEAAGLQVGDRILDINGFTAERATYDTMMLFFRLLRPVAVYEMTLVRGAEPPRKLRLEAHVKEGRALEDFSHVDYIWSYIREAELDRETFRHHVNKDAIGYLQLPSFTGSKKFWNSLAKEVRSAQAIVIDLRGNPGGYVDSLLDFIGYFEPEPLVVADEVGRKKAEPQRVKPQKPVLNVPLFILVDSESSSAAEMFARHFQRRERAVVIGDRTSGRVTAARGYVETVGTDVVAPFLVQVAVARVVLPGGEELEGRGVTPDHLCIPSADDLRAERDPCRVLAYALARKKLGLVESNEEPSGEEQE
jgi:carboxyl-terminal processing protease